MASNFKLGTAGRNAGVNAITALLNGGRMELRTGSPPTNVGDASSGTLLATLTFNATAAGSASGGTGTFNSITSDTNVDASGDVGYFRAYATGGADTAAIFQGTAGEAADTPDMTFDEKSFVAGGTAAITSLTLSIPVQ